MPDNVTKLPRLTPDDAAFIRQQRQYTVQATTGALKIAPVYCSFQSKIPMGDDWHVVDTARGAAVGFDHGEWLDEDPNSDKARNAGGILVGSWLDFDIDSNDLSLVRFLYHALEFLKLDTSFQFGRESIGAATHFIMEARTERPTGYLRKVECTFDDAKHVVEFRNGPKVQTLLPGSLYTKKAGRGARRTGDPSIWYSTTFLNAQLTPHKVDWDRVVLAAIFGFIARLLHPYWTEGNRHDLCLTLSGYLARLVRTTMALLEDDLSDDYHPFPNDEAARELIRFLCSAFDDSELKLRLAAYDNTGQKLDADPHAHIPGRTKLEAMTSPEVAQLLDGLIIPNEKLIEFQEALHNHPYLHERNEWIDRKSHKNGSKWGFTNADMRNRYANKWVPLGGKKPVNLFTAIMASTSRLDVTSARLMPNEQPGAIIARDGGHVFNIWTGFAVSMPDPVDKALLAEAKGDLDQCLHWLTDKKGHHRWIKNWAAHIFAFPGTKPQVALFFLGDQGLGKSFFIDHIISPLIGTIYCSQPSAKSAQKEFTTTILDGKLLTFFDEPTFDTSAMQDILKNWTRKSRMQLEGKGEHAYHTDVFFRLVFASNREDAGTAIGEYDRTHYYVMTRRELSRAEWLEISVKQVKPFYRRLHEKMQNFRYRQHMRAALCTEPVDLDLLESTEESDRLDHSQMARRDVSELVLKGLLEAGYIIPGCSWEQPFSKEQLGEAIRRVAPFVSVKTPPQTERVLAKIREMFGIKAADMFKSFRNVPGTGTLTAKRYFFPRRYGDCIEAFTRVFGKGYAIEPQHELGPDDYGVNHNTYFNVPSVVPPDKF